MNRRNFIKSGVFWVPTIFVPRLIRAADLRSEILKVQAWQKAHASSGGGACTLYVQNTTISGGRDVGLQNATFYAGQRNWSDAAAKTICRLDFALSLANGSITGKTFTARIWTMSGANNLGTNVASSTGVTGSNGWSNTFVEFDFPTPYLTTGSTSYGLTVDSGAVDGTNNATCRFNSSDTGLAGTFDRWSNALVNQDGTGEETAIKIYSST